MNVDDLVWLRAVHEHGSFRGAAGHRVAVSTVTRRIDALERELGLRLVDRRADGVRLTTEGERVAALAVDVVESADRLARAATAMQTDSIASPIVVSAIELFVSEVLAPRIPLLFDGGRPVSVTLRTQMGVVSLAARDADIAIRMVRPQGDSLVVRRLGSIELGLFASDSFLGRSGAGPVELARTHLLVYDDGFGSIPENRWVESHGLSSAVVVRAGSTRALANAAVAGAGVAILPVVMGRRMGLTQLEVKAPPARQAWVVVHRDLARIPAVSAVRAWIFEACRQWLADEDVPTGARASRRRPDRDVG